MARPGGLILSPRVKKSRVETPQERQYDPAPSEHGDEDAGRHHSEPDGETAGHRPKHRAGRKHNTLAKKARTTREAACKAIDSAEHLTNAAKLAESRAAAAQEKHWKHAGGHGGSSSGHRQEWPQDLPEPPAAPAPPDLLHRLNRVEDRLEKVEVHSSPGGSPEEEEEDNRDAQWMSRSRSEHLSIISRSCMGCLRYGNIGSRKGRIGPAHLGWRSAAELSYLLGYDQSDIVEACKTSIDKEGNFRYEFEGPEAFPQNGENPSIRPLFSKSRRDRR
jgi:hypothetical protein